MGVCRRVIVFFFFFSVKGAATINPLPPPPPPPHLGYLVHQRLLLLLVGGHVLDAVHKPFPVPAPEQPPDKRGRLEPFQLVHVLPRPDEHDGGGRGGHGGQGAAAPGVAVHLGEDDRPHVDGVAERFGLVEGGLADGAVHDEDDEVGANGVSDLEKRGGGGG